MTLEAKRKNKSPRQAIAAHCKSCIYDKTIPGTWLQQVMECTVKTCELYEYRPHRKLKTNNANLLGVCPGSNVENRIGVL